MKWKMLNKLKKLIDCLLFICFVGFCKMKQQRTEHKNIINCELQSIGQQIGIQLLCFFCICLLFTAFFLVNTTHISMWVCVCHIFILNIMFQYAHMLLYYFLLFF